jgi:hypothetical protein
MIKRRQMTFPRNKGTNKKMRCAWANRVPVECPQGERFLWDLGVDAMIILTQILQKEPVFNQL